MQRSKATYPVFDDLITQNEFLLLVTLVALQASDPKTRNPDPEIAVLEDLQWLLAYWRADTDDHNRNDRVEMFFYGRRGFSELSLEETQAEIIGQLTDGWYEVEDEGNAVVSLGNVNDFLRWAWEKFILWEPEKTYPMLSSLRMALIVVDTAISFSQFVDHFEEYEVRKLMTFLTTENYDRQHPLWHVMDGVRSIEVEVMDNGDRVIHVIPEDADLPNIDIIYPGKGGEPLQLKVLE